MIVTWVQNTGNIVDERVDMALSFQDGVRTFDDFLRDGLLEYLDVNEENNALVCSDLITFSFFHL